MQTTTTVLENVSASKPKHPNTKMPPLSQNNIRRVIFPAIYHSGTPVVLLENHGINCNSKDEQQDPELMPAVSDRKLPSFDPINDPIQSFARSQPSSTTPSKPVRIPLDSRTPELVYTSTGTNSNNASIPIEATSSRRGQFTQRSILGRYQQPLTSDLYPESPRPLEKGSKLVSILRESSFGCSASPPRCASISSSSSDSESTRSTLEREVQSSLAPATIRRSASEPSSQKAAAKIHFDPRIWIREFQRTPEEVEHTWYTDQDMERFKRHTLALMIFANDRARRSTPKSPQIVATGTARTIGQPKRKSANFTQTALDIEGESDTLLAQALQNEDYRAMIAQQELQRVLIVDPHDICVRLFQKTFETLVPNVRATGATSSQQAMKLLERQSFDIILVEERLQVFHNQMSETGSQFIRTLRSIQTKDHVLWIGVSAHLKKDQSNLEASGADLCWSKPPPKMSMELRNQLLRTILLKRGQADFARELFGGNL